MIKWNSTHRNEFPRDGQEVVISVDGVNYISNYDSGKKIFRTNELLETFFKAGDAEILWVSHVIHESISLQEERSKVYSGKKKKEAAKRKT
jgi:hypothetical protein